MNPFYCVIIDALRCCYYISNWPVHGIFRHFVDVKASNCFKYSEFEVHSVTNGEGNWTTEFIKIIPAKWEVFVTSVDKVWIYRRREQSKKTKTSNLFKMCLIISWNGEHVRVVIAFECCHNSVFKNADNVNVSIAQSSRLTRSSEYM